MHVTLTETVMAEIRGRIANGQLLVGAKLPSIRMLSDVMGVSKTTVVEAYQRLAAQGAVAPRRGSGFYVTEARPALDRNPREPAERAIDSFWLTFQAREAGSDLLKPGSGWLPETWMPQASLRTALRGVARHAGADHASYDSPLGFEPLRRQVARRLDARGVACAEGQILLTDGATQALDLACRLLLEPGDTVLVDDPCYFNFRATLACHGARIVPVSYTPDGPDLERFEVAARTHCPRLYVTNSGCHNPTGATLSHAKAYRLLRLAEKYDMAVVEDDVFADLEHEPSPRLAAFDGLRRVVCVGSFSKTVSASVRCGFLAVAPEQVDALTRLKLATSFGSGRLAAEIVHGVILDSGYRRHVEGVRTKLASSATRTLARLTAAGLTPWLTPRAGMFVWASLPDELDAALVAHRALEAGVVFAPGEIFSASPEYRSCMRFNVAQCSEPYVFEVLGRAIDEACSA